jgi:peptidoglycan hydrolase CwlO-like protein
MRALRILSASLLLVVTSIVPTLGPTAALAQSVDDAKQTAEDAGRRAEAASGLVDEAVANRAEIETELADSISRVSDLSAQLTTVSVGIEKLHEQIGFADAEMSGLQDAIESQAIDAYMNAVAAPSVTLINSSNVEQALVVGQVVGDVINSGQETVDELVVKRKSLQELQVSYAGEQEELVAVKADMDAEMEHLTELYESADEAVAEAIRDANRLDQEYRNSLSAVDAARAKQAERTREDERSGEDTPSGDITTTIQPPTTSTTVATSPTTIVPTTTTTTGGDGGGGHHDFPPGVEQWRSLAASYFPASRVDEALAIMRCESGGDPDAYNVYSGASGLFQFLPSTWAATAGSAGFGGASVFDPEANIGVAAWLANRYQELGKSYWLPWSCRRVLG